MVNENAIREYLRELYAAAKTTDKWVPESLPRIVRELIECITDLDGRVAALEAQVSALSKPISEEEWISHNIVAPGWPPIPKRERANAIIAARLKEGAK